MMVRVCAGAMGRLARKLLVAKVDTILGAALYYLGESHIKLDSHQTRDTSRYRTR